MMGSLFRKGHGADWLGYGTIRNTDVKAAPRRSEVRDWELIMSVLEHRGDIGCSLLAFSNPLPGDPLWQGQQCFLRDSAL
jgi:hypothetical protein